ncbi:hypothetical protein BASA82_000918 [Batrachochytrium salamandrivorans]|nr:hypothetical protein BASA82_000918 [Batrachochytrium salamandrivorans]
MGREESPWKLVSYLQLHEVRSKVAQRLAVLLCENNTPFYSDSLIPHEPYGRCTHLRWIIGCIDASMGHYNTAAQNFSDAYAESPHITHLRSNYAIALFLHTSNTTEITRMADEIVAMGVSRHCVAAMHLVAACMMLLSPSSPIAIEGSTCQVLWVVCSRLVNCMGHPAGQEEDKSLATSTTLVISTPAFKIMVAKQVMQLANAQIQLSMEKCKAPARTSLLISLAVRCSWLCSQILTSAEQNLVIPLLHRIHIMSQSLVQKDQKTCSSSIFGHRVLFPCLNRDKIRSTTTVFLSIYLSRISLPIETTPTSTIMSYNEIIISGYSHYRSTQYEAALELFTRALPMTTGHCLVLQLIGCCLLNMNKPQSALFALRKSVDQSTENTDMLVNLAVVARKLQNTQLEVQILRRLLQVSRLDDLLWKNCTTRIIDLLCDSRQFQCIVDLCQEWRSKGGLIPRYLAHKNVFALLCVKRYMDAMQLCKQLLLACSNDWRASTYLGEAALYAANIDSKDSQEHLVALPEVAVSAFRRSLKIVSDVIHIPSNNHKTTHVCKPSDDIREHKRTRIDSSLMKDADAECLSIKSAEDRHSILAHIYANLGVALEQTGCYLAALGSFERAIALDPDDVETQANTALILLRLGKRTAAIKGWTAYRRKYQWTPRPKNEPRLDTALPISWYEYNVEWLDRLVENVCN